MTKKILLATFQPIEDDISKRNERLSVLEKRLGYYPKWCFPARTDMEFVFSAWLSTPTYPEKVVLFESDEYERFDTVSWNQLLCSEDWDDDERLFRCFENIDERYAEYVVPRIENVVQETSIHDFIFNSDFSSELFAHSVNAARRVILANWAQADEREKRILCKEAFTWHCARWWWFVATGKEIPLETVVPFFPDFSDAAQCDLWEEAYALRSAIYIHGDGGHADYDRMRSLVTRIVETRYEEFAAMTYGFRGRNGACGCGSGRKFKKCHMRFNGRLREEA